MLRDKQDIDDFTNGCCFFGTGGGGNSSFGQAMLMQALESGNLIRIIPINDIANEDWIVCPYLMGTSGPVTEKTKQLKIKHGLIHPSITNMPYAAVQLLLDARQEKIALSAIIPYEIGAAATASAVATAALLGLPTLDADFVGRSVPEATQMLPAIYGLDLCPTACSDAFGNQSIITSAINRHMLERIGKQTASACFGLIGQATLLEKSNTLKPYMLEGTLSKAFKVGQLLRQCSQDQNNVDDALHALIGSKKIFKGIVSKFEGANVDGYYQGHIELNGVDDDAKKTMKIWFKNENHIAWINNQVCMTSPDLISAIDSNTYLPYVNNELKSGMNITIFGTPSEPAWKQPKALDANNPRYYGYDVDTKNI